MITTTSFSSTLSNLVTAAWLDREREREVSSKNLQESSQRREILVKDWLGLRVCFDGSNAGFSSIRAIGCSPHMQIVFWRRLSMQHHRGEKPRRRPKKKQQQQHQQQKQPPWLQHSALSHASNIQITKLQTRLPILLIGKISLSPSLSISLSLYISVVLLLFSPPTLSLSLPPLGRYNIFSS